MSKKRKNSGWAKQVQEMRQTAQQSERYLWLRCAEIVGLAGDIVNPKATDVVDAIKEIWRYYKR